MSQENVEIVRRAFETFAQEGPEAMVEFWDPEIVLWLPSGVIQAGGTYRGHAAVLDWMKEWAEAWEEIDYTAEEFTEAGECVLVSVLYTDAARGAGLGLRAGSGI
jgi:ketosteroid isomerase-like protein